VRAGLVNKKAEIRRAIAHVKAHAVGAPKLKPIPAKLRDQAVLLLTTGHHWRNWPLRLDCVHTLLGDRRSWPVLERLMFEFERPRSYEIAHSVFLLLGLYTWPANGKLRSKFQQLTRLYLLNAPKDPAASCFEGAHLLADKEWGGRAGVRFVKRFGDSSASPEAKHAVSLIARHR
jgi:hypothetical protein